MSKSIIFLDIDGVVTSARDNGFRDFNLHVIHWLTFLCKQSDTKLVISSTWRFSHNKEFWETIFPELIHEDWRTKDVRVVVGERHLRGKDIEEWLGRHNEVTQYVILDDDSDFLEEQKPFFIACDPMNGMLFDSIMKLRDLLEVKAFPNWQAEIYQHPNMFELTRERNEKEG